jgi:hypothetical protein
MERRTVILLAADPGKHFTALAVWVVGNNLREFVRAELVGTKDNPAAARRTMAQAVVRHTRNTQAHLFCELPQSYTLAQQKGSQNDLIEVAVSVGAIVGATSADTTVTLVTPAEWKGQLPKDVHHARIAKHITPTMRAHVEAYPKHLQHNVLDAIALGLWALERKYPAQ